MSLRARLVRLGVRAFIMQNMIMHENQVRLMFEGPTRGLLGYKNQFIVEYQKNHHIPPEGALGGAATMYPEFMKKLKELPKP